MRYDPPVKDITFALYEVLEFERHLARLAPGVDLDRDQVALLLSEAARFAVEEIGPLNAVGDRQGCRLENGRVLTPAGFRDAYRTFVDSGWPALSHDPGRGGQGAPHTIYCVLYEILNTANHAWAMYPGLSSGAIRTIERHGTDEQKATFLPGLIKGEWTAAMCLTETHCGSDLGLLKTRASPAPGGRYSVTGTKVFISSGEHDLTENIIYLVLARLPDAPQGTRGISLFIVPKFEVGPDGSIGRRNGVNCTAIENKMGIHGNATCTLQYEGAAAYLLGPVNQGLSAMFTFINESRINVAMQGLAAAERSQQGAARYALERRQMRATPRRLPDAPADPIIAHPDVRRMLLTQKALAEGGRMLVYDCAQQVDVAAHGVCRESRGRAESRLALLTPIAKGFLSEVGIEAANLGIQVLGGYGYITGSGMEQIARDVRITAIYEGTNGIQALDLLERKILGNSGAALSSFVGEILAFCRDNERDLRSMCEALAAHAHGWLDLVEAIKRKSSQDGNMIGASAHDHMMFAGYVTLGYFWARAAVVARLRPPLSGEGKSFRQAKLATARFYFERLLPRAKVHAELAGHDSSALMNLEDEEFLAGFAP